MTPEDSNPNRTRKQIETRMRTLYLCAIALLRYETELKQQLSEVNVSRQFQTSSSGDKKTLSPEEQEEPAPKHPRIPTDPARKL